MKWKEGKWCLQQYFLFEINRISELWNGNNNEDLEQRHDVFRSFQEITFLAIKVFLERSENVLATFWYNKFYRWPTHMKKNYMRWYKVSRSGNTTWWVKILLYTSITNHYNTCSRKQNCSNHDILGGWDFFNNFTWL